MHGPRLAGTGRTAQLLCRAEHFLTEQIPKAAPHQAARAGASGRGFTHLEQHLLQRGPPGWEWLLRPPLQLLPGQRKKGKNTIKIRAKFRPGEWRYLPAEAAQQRGRISAAPRAEEISCSDDDGSG